MSEVRRNSFYVEKPKQGEPWDVAIIGGGPAGLTSAIYTTRGAASTIIFAGETWGGQLMLTTTVDNFPGFPEGVQGPELMKLMRRQAERFGALFLEQEVSSVNLDSKPFEILSKNQKYFSKTLIIATGAQTRWLGVPGEDKLRGRGVSSCAPCDAPFFKDKVTAVVGGGDSAMEEALVLTKYARKVFIVHRRGEFRASAILQARIFELEKNGLVKILWDSEVVEMLGDQKLEALRLKTRLDSQKITNVSSLIQEIGGRLIEEKEGYAFWEMKLDGVFVAIGHVPASGIFQGKIELDERGYVKKIPKDGFNMSTSVEGVFVAGDVHDAHYRQAITAAGFGCMAAMEALKYLDKGVPSW